MPRETNCFGGRFLSGGFEGEVRSHGYSHFLFNRGLRSYKFSVPSTWYLSYEKTPWFHLEIQRLATGPTAVKRMLWRCEKWLARQLHKVPVACGFARFWHSQYHQKQGQHIPETSRKKHRIGDDKQKSNDSTCGLIIQLSRPWGRSNLITRTAWVGSSSSTAWPLKMNAECSAISLYFDYFGHPYIVWIWIILGGYRDMFISVVCFVLTHAGTSYPAWNWFSLHLLCPRRLRLFSTTISYDVRHVDHVFVPNSGFGNPQVPYIL